MAYPNNQTQAFPAAGVQNAHQQQDFTSYKNILQEYAQKSRILNPKYEVVNEGSSHAPQFRATVLVGERQYTSPNTFAQKKAAEQDAAKFAFGCIEQFELPIQDKEEEEETPIPIINEYANFSKSILNEFAMKMKLEKPTYNTSFQPSDSMTPSFRSDVTFKGNSYTGEAGNNKKEAEHFAASAAILTLLESNEFKNALSDIIKSKAKSSSKLNTVTDAPMNNDNKGSSSQLGTVQVPSPRVANPAYYHTLKNYSSFEPSPVMWPNQGMVSLPPPLYYTVESSHLANQTQAGMVYMPPFAGNGFLMNNDDARSSQFDLVEPETPQVIRTLAVKPTPVSNPPRFDGSGSKPTFLRNGAFKKYVGPNSKPGARVGAQ